MRLISLSLRSYRVHQQLTVDFDPNRFLIGGRNESGKSTLVEAAHRALFLQAKTGGKIQKDMVSTRHQGDPEVTLIFEAAGCRWELEKRFSAQRGSTRLSTVGSKPLLDEAADQKLAELLKTQATGGRSAAGSLEKRWSHLWIWQGSSGENPAPQSAQHMPAISRQLQGQGIAAMLQSATDERVASRVATSYESLFTATGRDKAGAKPDLALHRLNESATELTQAKNAARQLQQAADNLARALRDIANDESQRPALRQHIETTTENLNLVAELQRREMQQHQQLDSAQQQHAQLLESDLHIRRLQDTCQQYRDALVPDTEKLRTLHARESSANTDHQSADATLRHCRARSSMAREQDILARAQLTVVEKTLARNDLSQRCDHAAAIRLELLELRAQLARLPQVTEADLAQLRHYEQERGRAQSALEAMAAGIELIESDNAVLLDGHRLQPGAPHILTTSGALLIGEKTRILIRPGGGKSLEDARSSVEQNANALNALLLQLSLNDHADASATLEQRRLLETDIRAKETRWRDLDGERLESQLHQAQNELDQALADLQRRDASAATDAVILSSDLAQARQRANQTSHAAEQAHQDEKLAEQHAEHRRALWNEASTALRHLQEQLEVAREQLRDLEMQIRAYEDSRGDAAQRAQNLALAAAARSDAETKLQQTRQDIDALNPQQLQADLDRFNRSMQNLESRLQAANNSRLISEYQLKLDGSTDPQADLLRATIRHRSATEQYEAEKRRAAAIKLLHDQITEARGEFNKRLTQPLADRISDYLRAVYGPAAEARLSQSDSEIIDIQLYRPGFDTFSFDALSGGTREQTAAAVRLAMAEILAADHDGCLPIVFDDAFANSDTQRIESLQRMLDLAARRGLQVIVLSCNPRDFSSFGATEFSL